MATVADMIFDVRSHLDEASAGFWEDDELARWIWEASRDIARRTEWNQKRLNINTVANQQTYTLPDDMFRIFRVEYRRSTGNSYALEYQDFALMDDIWFTSRESTGEPQWWSIWGAPGVGTDQLYLYPVPSTSITTGLIVYYYAVPKKVDTNDFSRNVEVPSGWEDIIPLYVEYVARRKESRDSRWREAFELYEIRLGEMMKTTRQWTDQERFVSGGSHLPGWLTGTEY